MHARMHAHTISLSHSIDKRNVGRSSARAPPPSLSGTRVHTHTAPVLARVRRRRPLCTPLHSQMSERTARWPLPRHFVSAGCELDHVDKEISESVIDNPCEQAAKTRVSGRAQASSKSNRWRPRAPPVRNPPFPRRRSGLMVQSQSCSPVARDRAARCRNRTSKPRSRESPWGAPAARVRKSESSDGGHPGGRRSSATELTWPTRSRSRLARTVNYKPMGSGLMVAVVTRTWA